MPIIDKIICTVINKTLRKSTTRHQPIGVWLVVSALTAIVWFATVGGSIVGTTGH